MIDGMRLSAGEEDVCDEGSDDDDVLVHTRIDAKIWRCFREQIKITTDNPPNDSRSEKNEDDPTLEEICYDRIWQARLRRDQAFGVNYV